MKHWKFIALVLLVFLLCLVLIIQAKEHGTSFVMTPRQILESEDELLTRRRMQVVGKVAAHDIEYKTEPYLRLSFRVSDRDYPNFSVPVVYNGLKPDMFAPDREVIISGTFDGTIIQASTLQTQCPSKYESPDAESIANRYANDSMNGE